MTNAKTILYSVSMFPGEAREGCCALLSCHTMAGQASEAKP